MLYERGKAFNCTLWKEDLPISQENCENGRERNWVAMIIGTLLTSKERMLECIHMKF
jgi:hypothetical protein